MPIMTTTSFLPVRYLSSAEGGAAVVAVDGEVDWEASVVAVSDSSLSIA